MKSWILRQFLKSIIQDLKKTEKGLNLECINLLDSIKDDKNKFKDNLNLIVAIVDYFNRKGAFTPVHKKALIKIYG